jgi:hypothetical protein
MVNILQSVGTGYCLDGNTKGQIYGLSCNGGPYQDWTTNQDPGSEVYSLVSRGTGYCLDGNAKGQIYGQPCNGGPYQNWTLSQIDPPCNIFTDDPILSCYVGLISLGTGLCLEVSPEGVISGNTCDIFKNDDNILYQEWAFENPNLETLSGNITDNNTEIF